MIEWNHSVKYNNPGCFLFAWLVRLNEIPPASGATIVLSEGTGLGEKGTCQRSLAGVTADQVPIV